MENPFWDNLPRPFFALAPLADVTDAAFRRVIAKYGKPDILFTEFTSADGLVRADKSGREALLKNLEYTEAERPIVAQLFSAEPKYMEQGAALVRELGFDGVDINMGCPDRSVEKQGAGAALIRAPQLATELIDAARAGAGELPVSIKTRIGYNRRDEFEEWMRVLLPKQLPALTLHARTRKEMSKVPADWEYVRQLVALRDEIAPETLILGNGDVWSLADAKEKVAVYGCDGVMLGRAIFGNPHCFHPDMDISDLPIPERLAILLEHTKLFSELLGEYKPLHIMKKHYKAYVSGWDGAKELRMRLMDAESVEEIEKVIDEYVQNYELTKTDAPLP